MISDSPEQQAHYSLLVSSELVSQCDAQIELRIPREDGDIAMTIPQRGVDPVRLADANHVRQEILSLLGAITDTGSLDTVSTSGAEAEPNSLLTLEIPRKAGSATVLIHRHIPERQLANPNERLNAVGTCVAAVRQIINSPALRIQRYPVLRKSDESQ